MSKDFICHNCMKSFSTNQRLLSHIEKDVCAIKKKEEQTITLVSLDDKINSIYKLLVNNEEKEEKELIRTLKEKISILELKVKDKEKSDNEKISILELQLKEKDKKIKELEKANKLSSNDSLSSSDADKAIEKKKSPPKKSSPKKSPPRLASGSKEDDIKPFLKEKIQNVKLPNIKFGNLYANENLAKYYLFYDDTKEYIWSYSMTESYKETQDVFPLTRMSISMRNKLKKYGFKLLDTDEEFEKRYHNCKDNRSISTLMYEKKQMEEVNVSEDELVDNINCLCNKIVDSEDNSRLDEYGIFNVPLYVLYQIKNEYKMWIDQREDIRDNKEKKTKINELLSLCHYNYNNIDDKYLSNLYTFLDEIDISCDYAEYEEKSE